MIKKPTEHQRKTFKEVMNAYELDDKEIIYLMKIGLLLALNGVPCNKSVSKVLSAMAMWSEMQDNDTEW